VELIASKSTHPVFNQLFRIGKPQWEYLKRDDGTETWSWRTSLSYLHVTKKTGGRIKKRFSLTWCFKEYYDEGEQSYLTFEEAETGAIEQLIMKLIPCLDLSPMTELLDQCPVPPAGVPKTKLLCICPFCMARKRSIQGDMDVKTK